MSSLEATWCRIPFRTADPTSSDRPIYANRTLHADVPFALAIRELMRADPVGSRALVRGRIRKVVTYSAKLGRRRSAGDEVDLFTVLPTTSSCSSPTVPTGLIMGIDRDHGRRWGTTLR